MIGLTSQAGLPSGRSSSGRDVGRRPYSENKLRTRIENILMTIECKLIEDASTQWWKKYRLTSSMDMGRVTLNFAKGLTLDRAILPAGTNVRSDDKNLILPRPLREFEIAVNLSSADMAVNLSAIRSPEPSPAPMPTSTPTPTPTSTSTSTSTPKRQFNFETAGKLKKPAKFEVVSFTGEEAISTLYRFELLLVSKQSDIDESLMVGVGATFTMSDGVEKKSPVHYKGVLREFDQLYNVNDWFFYKAVLVPKLWILEAFYRSEVYLEKTRTDILEELMKVKSSFTTLDYDIRIKEESDSPQKLPYVCQYKETDLNFIARWAERLGVYWWYECDADKSLEKVVFCDREHMHPHCNFGLRFQSGNFGNPAGDSYLTSFILKTKLLPKKLTVEGYNYDNVDDDQANKKLHVEVEVDSKGGVGDIYHYEGHLSGEKQAKDFAKLLADAVKCKGKQFLGKSLATGLRCGYKVMVSGHYRSGFDGKYLLTHVKHCGSQPVAGVSGLDVIYKLADMPAQIFSGTEHAFFYEAEFTAIPEKVQFRSEMNHPWPVIEGTMKAFIDGAASKEAKYALVDKEGRYKMQVPFKVDKKEPLKGSAWVRRAAIYAGVKSGENYGIYFPLHQGTEVLLTFIRGNPDQPVVLMAVPNSRHQPLVTDANCTQSIIKTAGGNFIGMEDQNTGKGLLIESPTAKTMIRLGDKGAMSNTLPEAKPSESNGLSAYTEENITLKADQKINVKAGDTISIKAKNKISIESEISDVNITAQGKVSVKSLSDSFWNVSGKSITYFGGPANLNIATGNKTTVLLGAKQDVAGSTLGIYGHKAEIIAPLGKQELVYGPRIQVASTLVYEKKLGVWWSISTNKIETNVTKTATTAVDIEKKEVTLEANGKTVETNVSSVTTTGNNIVTDGTKVVTEGTVTRKRAVSLETNGTKKVTNGADIETSTTRVRSATVTKNSGVNIF
ncbi:type VI secretion system tip protein TssI/VgrG [Candidatus Methylospira mobilis]|uniref:type VI secretion system Vgr family protein n=1 Tax=Candidatus Methylospira mobilis TaxID=1808979 RepID=UPI0028E7D0FF|nr:type VI secretion system tip protein TssI/VgrG [Candidatus Methylospira mobilis]WNV05184.1 type VI secretion system tip protein TssI/VgrG [Candidatus Methylospira mobilis]